MEHENFMLCESIKNLSEVNLNNYFANEKKDGERIVAMKQGNEVYLFNRRKNEKSKFFSEITETLKKFDFDYVIDGEVCSKDGLFNSFQQRGNLRNLNEIEKRRKTYPLVFCVFDVLKINGQDLTKLPLSDRKEYLKQFKLDNIIPLDFVEREKIIELWESVKKEDKEGIILKDKNSKYEFRRSKSWLKCKNFREVDITITKYTINNAGIRAETNDGISVQIAGEQHKAVKKQIDEKGFCEIEIQYLNQSEKTKAYRMPSFRGIK